MAGQLIIILCTGASTVKLYSVVIDVGSIKLECFPMPFTSTADYHFWERLEPTKVGFHKGLHSGRFLALPENIRLGWKGISVENTLAYNDTE